MSSPIVEKIMKDGVQSLKVGMLPPDMRRRILEDAGSKLLHAGELSKAAETWTLGGCTDELRKTADWLMEQHRYAHAALFLRPVGRPDELEHLASLCVAAGEIEVARSLYKELGQHAMVQFLDANVRK